MYRMYTQSQYAGSRLPDKKKYYAVLFHSYRLNIDHGCTFRIKKKTVTKNYMEIIIIVLETRLKKTYSIIITNWQKLNSLNFISYRKMHIVFYSIPLRNGIPCIISIFCFQDKWKCSPLYTIERRFFVFCCKFKFKSTI